MTWLWSGMVVLSVLFGLATGKIDAVSDAALDGAASAVELSLTMAGVLCLWSGVMPGGAVPATFAAAAAPGQPGR